MALVNSISWQKVLWHFCPSEVNFGSIFLKIDKHYLWAIDSSSPKFHNNRLNITNKDTNKQKEKHMPRRLTSAKSDPGFWIRLSRLIQIWIWTSATLLPKCCGFIHFVECCENRLVTMRNANKSPKIRTQRNHFWQFFTCPPPVNWLEFNLWPSDLKIVLPFTPDVGNLSKFYLGL